jgi:transposase-like protein
VHPNQVTEWRRQLLERAAGVFGAAATPEAPAVDLKALHAKIGQLTLENEYEGTPHFLVAASSAKIDVRTSI